MQCCHCLTYWEGSTDMFMNVTGVSESFADYNTYCINFLLK